MKQLKLPIDHTPHIEYVARQLAKQLQEEHGYRSYDHAYKSACHLLNFFREEGEQDDSSCIRN